jgi:hypothetical protein
MRVATPLPSRDRGFFHPRSGLGRSLGLAFRFLARRVLRLEHLERHVFHSALHYVLRKRSRGVPSFTYFHNWKAPGNPFLVGSVYPSEMKKPSAAGIRIQAEWAECVARAAAGTINPEWPRYTVDEAHGEARRIEWVAAEKVRKANKKAAQIASKAAQAEADAKAPHCQVCARPILANTGIIAHHGYERPGSGWQTASCFGARALPYERAHDKLDLAIESVTGQLANTTEALARFIAEPPATLTYLKTNYNKGYYAGRRWVYEEIPVRLARPEGFEVEGKDNVYGQERTYRQQYNSERTQLTSRIEQLKSTLRWFRARRAAWVAPEGLADAREGRDHASIHEHGR